MLVNFILGFVIPWIFGAWLLLKNKRVLVLIGPIASVIGFTIDVIGFQLDYWHIKPYYDTEIFSALPFHWGLYPVLSSFLVYFIERQQLKPVPGILIFSLITTVVEGIGVIADLVEYHNHWNIFWTFLSYVLSYVGVYGYYLILKNLKVSLLYDDGSQYG